MNNAAAKERRSACGKSAIGTAPALVALHVEPDVKKFTLAAFQHKKTRPRVSEPG
jgi:hypothetical protein